MSLSNLIHERIEHYGGIDLKRSYQGFFSKSLAFSIGLHCLVLFSYLAYNFFTEEDEKKIPRLRIRNLAELAPPPSTSQEPEAIPAGAPPPPSADIAKPNLGIVAPVPDFKAPQTFMPDQNVAAPAPVGDGPPGGPVGEVGGTGSAPVVVSKPVEEDEPRIDDFVSVEQDPTPIQNIQSLVVYPEIAKRAGIEGKVTVSALIGKNGAVEKVEIVKSDNKMLEDAAKDAMMRAKFTPARQNGQPVRVWFTVPIQFRLQSR